MCGRYSIAKDSSELEKVVRFVYRSPQFKARYNIAPRSFVPVLVWDGETVRKNMRWGMIPPWAKDEAIGDKMINARAETLTEKASFKKPFQTQRCLVPLTSYFEWEKTGAGKIPFQFSMVDDRFFFLAGFGGLDVTPILCPHEKRP